MTCSLDALSKNFVALLVCFATLGSGWCEADETLPADVAKKDLHIYLLVGQSNMAGRGKVTPADKKPLPRIFMLDKKLAWVPATDPMHFDKPPIVGVGLGRTFASEVAAKYPQAIIGLVPCAVGGSPIAAWEPGGYHASTKTHPYDDCLPRIRHALQRGTLKGILWHQGESDCKEGLASVYRDKLHAVIARFRQELQAPDVPFVAGQMGQFAERPWNDAKKTVDAAHRVLPQEVKRTAFVSSDGLGHKGDKVHFSADAYRELGRRYAEAYLKLTAE